ncbi:hypothetical protein D3C72_1340840 [compost metagenome]
MVHQTLAHDGDRLEPPVRMRRKTRHLLAVVHAEAVLAAEVHADLAALQQLLPGTQLAVAGGIAVLVVHAEDERIDARQALVQGLGAEDDGGVVVLHGASS